MSMKSFNVGIIGIGDISDVYIRNLQQYGISMLTRVGLRLEKALSKA